jgi:hypothetical protein
MDRRKVRLLGNRLRGVDRAFTARQRKGKVLVTDRPFAIEIAAKHSMACFGRIEVRPCWPEKEAG